MAEYKRTSLNFIETKKSHKDAAIFLSLVGKYKTAVVVKLVMNYLKSCGVNDVSELDEKTAKKMANTLIIPNENNLMSNLIQELRKDLFSAIASGTAYGEANLTATLEPTLKQVTEETKTNNLSENSTNTAFEQDLTDLLDEENDLEIDESTADAINTFSV